MAKVAYNSGPSCPGTQVRLEARATDDTRAVQQFIRWHRCLKAMSAAPYLPLKAAKALLTISAAFASRVFQSGLPRTTVMTRLPLR